MAIIIITLAYIINWSLFAFDPLLIKNNRKIWLLIFYVILGVIIGMRSNHDGIDTISYFDTYNMVANYTLYETMLISHMEIGYLLLNKVFTLFGFDYHSFQFVFSIVMMLLFGNFIYKNTKDVYLATLVFLGAGFFAFSYNTIRQMMAIAICANSWMYIKEGKYIKSIIIILIAVTIHLTSILYIIPLVLYIFRNSRVVRLGFPFLLMFLASFLPIIFRILQDYNMYNSYTDIDKAGIKGGFVYIIWIIEIAMVVFVIMNKKFSSQDKVIANLALFNVVLTMMDEKVRYLDRIGLVFFPFVLLLFCIFGDKLSGYNNKLLYLSSVSLFFFVFFIYRSSEIAQFTLSF